MKFSRKVGNGSMNKLLLNFGGDPDRRLDTGIVFLLRQFWVIRKVVNGRKDDHLRGREECVRVRVQHARVSNGIAPDSQPGAVSN